MKFRKIIRYPDERLLTPSKEVADFNEEVRALAGEMTGFLLHNGGFGIAAVQWGVPLRMAAVKPGGKADEPVILINPEIIKAADAVMDDEGCLSMPGLWLKIPRPRSLEISAFDVHGKKFTMRFSGYSARAVCHEIDHFNGRLIWDHLPKNERRSVIRDFLNGFAGF
jgi:peptide deformylase